MGLITPNDIQNFQSLYNLQLQYLLSAERQIVKGLQSMIDNATEQQLKQAFQSHLAQTEQHVQRLRNIIPDVNDGDVDDKKCAVTAALIAAGENIVKESDPGAVRDAGLLASAQKIEHYEIASYGTARDWAAILGLNNHVQTLQKTLDEEKQADQILNNIAQQTNPQAARTAQV